jgi:hypothetical protein
VPGQFLQVSVDSGFFCPVRPSIKLVGRTLSDLVHPAGHNANSFAPIAGDVIALDGAHAKVRRAGYRSK